MSDRKKERELEREREKERERERGEDELKTLLKIVREFSRRQVTID